MSGSNIDKQTQRELKQLERERRNGIISIEEYLDEYCRIYYGNPRAMLKEELIKRVNY